MRLGIHTSISKSLEHAARTAASYGANTFQIFSASPRLWKANPPDPAAIEKLNEAREELDLNPLVVHDSYLINLASTDPIIRPKSIVAFRGELERCIALGADYLVAHPGNYKGQSIDEGIGNVAAGITEAADGLNTGNLMLLLENTAGSGATLGSRFEELAAIRDLAARTANLPIGYCLDTAHCLESGYDLSTEAGLADMMRQARETLGLENVRVLHANDSKTPLGSRVDRHEHIGKGHIGTKAFRRILTHPGLRDKAFILETPQQDEGDEIKNMKALKRLCRNSSTTTTR